ncbi:hypothetical protein EC973_007170 [Apophysomyces ossiformis]|uniref:Indoleamine 2,3-dioxygenase n=1 Tax=Apophysomyces ossiformis TaxID=679940 RepID=A0A8H7BXT7_9FUNG|nr:hypothetical protein EC973_007170 [Apophysomyces ossiformis]
MSAMYSMRSLEDYDISPETGFLPTEPPLRRLHDPYFAPWENMMDDFNGLLLADSDGPIDLSNLAALVTYSGSLDEAWFYLVTTAIESAGAPCLKAIISSIDHVKNSDFEALRSDLITIEAAVKNMNAVLERMYEKCDPYVFYWKIRPYLAGWENMAEAGLPFGLVYEGVDSLWNAETDEYGDMSHLSDAERLLRQYRRYAGGSAAQSSLIAALDVALGVEHFPTGQKPPVMKLDTSNDRYTHLPSTMPADELKSTGSSSPRTPSTFVRTNRNAFLRAMRKYMPRLHREFLEDLELAANLRPFMLDLQERVQCGEASEEEGELLELYDKCVHQLKLFRDTHVRIVSLYIVSQARKGPNIAHGGFAIDKKAPKQVNNEDQASTDNTMKAHNVLYPQTALETSPVIREGSVSAKMTHLFPQLGLAKYVDPKTGVVRGTGGTNVMPFLKQSRDETNSTKLLQNSEIQQSGTNVPKDNMTQKSWSDWLMRR